MDCNKYQKFIHKAVDAGKDPLKYERITEHTDKCSACHGYATDMAIIDELLPDALQAELPEDFIASTMQRIKTDEAKPQSNNTLKFWLLLAAAVVLIAFAISALNTQTPERIPPEEEIVEIVPGPKDKEIEIQPDGEEVVVNPDTVDDEEIIVDKPVDKQPVAPVDHTADLLALENFLNKAHAMATNFSLENGFARISQLSQPVNGFSNVVDMITSTCSEQVNNMTSIIE